MVMGSFRSKDAIAQQCNGNTPVYLYLQQPAEVAYLSS